MKTISVYFALCLLLLTALYTQASATVTSYTFRSYLPGHTTVVQMLLIDSGNGSVRVTTSTVTPSNDTGFMFFMNPASYNSNSVTLNNNGHTNWQIPFDTSSNPSVIAGGGSTGPFTCICKNAEGQTQTGQCNVYVTQTIPVVRACCDGCYNCEITGFGSSVYQGNLFLTSDKVYYNGTLYQ